MAQTNLPLHYLTPDAGQADPTGAASTAGAGNEFVVQPDGISHRLLFLRVQNAGGSSATVTVLAGSQPSAISSGQGPVTYTVPATSTGWVGPFDSSRLQQPDGSLLVQSSAVLTVTAFSIDARYV